ncbi:MAG TPA: PH domain-containing protein [Micropepsaceae bacterium]|nr:PH domain-containing protein [Micropepsaceae bacterium]
MSSYVERSLGNGERVVAKAHFHWLYTLKALLALIIPFVVLIVILLFGRAFAGGWLIIVGMLLMLAGIIIFFRRMIRRWTTEIAVTSHRFVEKYGLVSLRTNEIALANIEGVRIYQGFWGRIWGYGTLRIEGTGIDKVDIPPIADPIGFRRAIETAKSIK